MFVRRDVVSRQEGREIADELELEFGPSGITADDTIIIPSEANISDS